MESVFNPTKNYRMLVHGYGELRFPQDQNHRQEILDYSLRRHIQSLIGTSKQRVSETGVLFTHLYDDASAPSVGEYTFTLTASDTLDVLVNGGAATSITLTSNQTSGLKPIEDINGTGICGYLNPEASVNDSVTVIANNAIRYNGCGLSYDGSQYTVSSGLVSVNGYDVNINTQTKNFVLSEGESRIVVMDISFREVDRNEDGALGHYIQGQGEFNDPSPKALKLEYEFTTVSDINNMQSVSGHLSIAFGEIGVSGNPYAVDYVQRVDDVLQNPIVIDQLNTTEISRLKMLVNNLTIDLEDGHGLRTVTTDKVPSMPNKVDTTTVAHTLTPDTLDIANQLFDRMKLREAEIGNKSALNTHILKLQELKSAAVAAADKTEITPKVNECESLGALDSSQADYIRDTATLSEVPTLVGDEDSGYIGDKNTAKQTAIANIESYESEVSKEMRSIEPEPITHPTGKLKIWWDEPALVDNEEIVGYKVKLCRMKLGFTETSTDLKTANIDTPDKLIDQRSTYLEKPEPLLETDRKPKQVSNGEVVYADTTQNREVTVEVTSGQKLVCFIAPITEFDVVGQWSDPVVFDLPAEVIDGQTGKTFEEFVDDRKTLMEKKQAIEAEKVNRKVEDKLFDLQVAYADKVDKTELVQKINQVQTA